MSEGFPQHFFYLCVYKNFRSRGSVPFQCFMAVAVQCYFVPCEPLGSHSIVCRGSLL